MSGGGWMGVFPVIDMAETLCNTPRRMRGRGTLAALAAASALVSPLPAAALDVLERPAALTARLASLVQLDVTNAGERLVSVGERGAILLSDDRGMSWRQAVVPVSVTLTRVRFPDANNGWAVGHGGVVLHTGDGGETWSRQLDGIAAARMELAAATAEMGDADASRRRLREAERLVAEGPDKPLLSLYFADARRGLVVGAYGLAFATEDGGRTWSSLMGRLQAADGRHLYAAGAVGDALYIAGEQGVLLVSDDGGRTFSRAAFPGKGTSFGMLAASSGVLVYGLKGSVHRGEAGGRWTRIDMPAASVTAGARLPDGALVLGNESGQIFRSRDDGRSFQPVPADGRVPVTGLAVAADGALVRSGMRGVGRVAFDDNDEEARK